MRTETDMQSPTIECAPPDQPFVVVEVTGELDLDTQDGFEAEVFRHLEGHSVVIDMSRLEFLAISSLRSLLLCDRSATEGHRRVVYAGPPNQARRLLEVSGLDGVLRVSPTLTDATELIGRA
jgi:anti-anti-sigma factor